VEKINKWDFACSNSGKKDRKEKRNCKKERKKEKGTTDGQPV
jgi:hypothetical protein